MSKIGAGNNGLLCIKNKSKLSPNFLFKMQKGWLLKLFFSPCVANLKCKAIWFVFFACLLKHFKTDLNFLLMNIKKYYKELKIKTYEIKFKQTEQWILLLKVWQSLV